MVCTFFYTWGEGSWGIPWETCIPYITTVAQSHKHSFVIDAKVVCRQCPLTRRWLIGSLFTHNNKQYYLLSPWPPQLPYVLNFFPCGKTNHLRGPIKTLRCLNSCPKFFKWEENRWSWNLRTENEGMDESYCLQTEKEEFWGKSKHITTWEEGIKETRTQSNYFQEEVRFKPAHRQSMAFQISFLRDIFTPEVDGRSPSETLVYQW